MRVQIFDSKVYGTGLRVRVRVRVQTMYWREAREEMREGGRVYISINSRLNNVLFGVSHQSTRPFEHFPGQKTVTNPPV